MQSQQFLHFLRRLLFGGGLSELDTKTTSSSPSRDIKTLLSATLPKQQVTHNTFIHTNKMYMAKNKASKSSKLTKKEHPYTGNYQINYEDQCNREDPMRQPLFSNSTTKPSSSTRTAANATATSSLR